MSFNNPLLVSWRYYFTTNGSVARLCDDKLPNLNALIGRGHHDWRRLYDNFLREVIVTAFAEDGPQDGTYDSTIVAMAMMPLHSRRAYLHRSPTMHDMHIDWLSRMIGCHWKPITGKHIAGGHHHDDHGKYFLHFYSFPL